MMIKRIAKIQLYISIVLFCLYGLAFWSINNEQKTNQQEISTQSPTPSGKKYMQYCDGDISDQLTHVDDESCLAENPGDFAKFALGIYATIIFLLTTVFCFIYLKFAARRKK